MSLTGVSTGMAPALKRGWWIFLVRGILALTLGIVAIVQPGATLAALIFLIGAFFIVDGALAIGKSLAALRSDRSWFVLALSGLLSVAIGIAVYRWPNETALTLGYLIGFWAIVTGVLEVVVAIALRRVITGEWLYVVFGIISIVFGIIVAIQPGLGLVYLSVIIAIYGFTAGFALLAVAFRLRRLRV